MSKYYPHTTVRLTVQARKQIDSLMLAGYGPSMASIIKLAVGRMFRQVFEGEVPPEKKPRAWAAVLNKDRK